MKKIFTSSLVVVSLMVATSSFASASIPQQLFCPTNTQLTKLIPSIRGTIVKNLFYAAPSAIGNDQCAVALAIHAESKQQAAAELKNAFLTESNAYPKNGSAGCVYDNGAILVLTYSKVNGSCTSSKVKALENSNISKLATLSKVE